jgi:hypothetical protein
MNATQGAKLNMYDAVKFACEDNATTVAALNAFKTAFDELKDKIAAIKEVAQQKDMPTGGAAADKKARKKNLSQSAGTMARAIYAYAATIGDPTLKEQANFTPSDLLRTKDEMLAPRCRNIHDLATANAEALKDYGVSAAKLTALQTAIDAFAEAVPRPRAAINTRSALKTSLKQLFAEADQILADRMDTLVELFAETNPAFIAVYQSARLIVDPQTTATQLKGVVTNQSNAAPVAGATITVVEAAQTANTDTDGEYLIKPLEIGTYTVTVTKTGFNNFQITGVEVKLGQVNSLNVELVSN